MFSFLKPKDEGKVIAVFAIESGSVALTVTRVKESEKERIIFIDRRALDVKTSDTPQDSLRKIAVKIDEILNSLFSRKYFHVIARSKVLVLLGSTWSISWRETIEIKKEKPFRLSEELIEKTIDEKFYMGHPELSIISSHLMEIRMNGYKIREPFGKTTSFLEFEVFVEAAPKEALGEIGKAIEKHLPHATLHFSTLTYAAVEAVTGYTKEKSFILILPEAKVTEMAVVKDGVVKAGASLPFGSLPIALDIFGSDAVRGAMLNEKEAISKVKRFIEGGLDSDTKSKTAAPIENAKQKFLGSFHGALFAMNDTVLCPSIVFVGGKSPAAFFINDWIKKEDYASQALTENCFKVTALSGSDLLDKSVFLGNGLPFVSGVSAHAAKVYAYSTSGRASEKSEAFEIEINKLK